ncbi:DUF6702 family protein [Flavobacterium sp.]|uniref:DUF6702 family protein n=1 Tax=Flavobacterium sp. TaxID=239 RepID=UPI00261B2862|nr:DUF6702 family protein [Flavobacterium sp.]
MRKILVLGMILFVTLSSFGVHKFYISIYQIHFVPQKKRIEITTRIFIDDLNKALLTKYAKTTHVGEAEETPEDVALMNQYLAEHFTIKVNGNKKPFIFMSKELENNVVIGYYKVNDIAKIISLDIKNTSLMEVFSEQQNIIQTNFNGKKQSLLLTNENTAGVLK